MQPFAAVEVNVTSKHPDWLKVVVTVPQPESVIPLLNVQIQSTEFGVVFVKLIARKIENIRKKCTPTTTFVSRNQFVWEGFGSPYVKKLNPKKYWIVLVNLIPWDEICNTYLKSVPKKQTGRLGLNPRIVLGSIVFMHLCDMDDRETVGQISELRSTSRIPKFK